MGSIESGTYSKKETFGGASFVNVAAYAEINTGLE